MNELTALAAALEAAIPTYQCDPTELAEFLDNPDIVAFETLLGESYCRYVEWKEFNENDINELQPMLSAGVSIDLSDLYEKLEDVEDYEELGINGPEDFFMPELQAQLAPHGLQVLEVCEDHGEGTIESFENPRLLCASKDNALIDQLNRLLSPLGVCLAG